MYFFENGIILSKGSLNILIMFSFLLDNSLHFGHFIFYLIYFSLKPQLKYKLTWAEYNFLGWYEFILLETAYCYFRHYWDKNKFLLKVAYEVNSVAEKCEI